MDTLDMQILPERIHALQEIQKDPGFFQAGETPEIAHLVYVTEGQLLGIINGTQILLQSGSCMLLAPGQWHLSYADADAAPRLLTVSFTTGASWNSAAIQSPSPTVAALLNAILEEHRQVLPHAQDMILMLLGQLLISFDREGILLPVQPMHGDKLIVCRAQKIIHSLSRQKLNVPLAAQKTGVSPSYLTALFHKHLHIAPGEYIRRVKLEESKQMIRTGDLNFTQIANALEYSTVHHFSRQFKENFGITPTQYANSVRQLP